MDESRSTITRFIWHTNLFDIHLSETREEETFYMCRAHSTRAVNIYKINTAQGLYYYDQSVCLGLRVFGLDLVRQEYAFHV